MKFYRPSELLILFVWPSFSHSHIWQLVAWSFDIALLGGRGSFFKFRQGRAFDTHRYRFSAFLVRESQHHPQDLRYKRSNRGNSRYYISVSIHSQSISIKRKRNFHEIRRLAKIFENLQTLLTNVLCMLYEILWNSIGLQRIFCNLFFFFFYFNEFQFYRYQSCLITMLMKFQNVLHNRYSMDIKVF